MNLTLARLHIVISGKIQGVFFRYHTQRLALSLKLTGWVKNNPDGTLECVIEGEKKSLEKMIQWFSEGPKNAKIEDSNIQWTDCLGEFATFDIL